MGWNDMGITIKVNSLIGKSLKFSEISRTELQDSLLSIFKNDRNRLEFDLSDVENTDVEKLFKILTKHSTSNR